MEVKWIAVLMALFSMDGIKYMEGITDGLYNLWRGLFVELFVRSAHFGDVALSPFGLTLR